MCRHAFAGATTCLLSGGVGTPARGRGRRLRSPLSNTGDRIRLLSPKSDLDPKLLPQLVAIGDVHGLQNFVPTKQFNRIPRLLAIAFKLGDDLALTGDTAFALQDVPLSLCQGLE